MLFPIFVPQGRTKTKYKVGYIDSRGSLAIDPVFNEGTRFHDGLAAVKVTGGRWGIIDATGTFVIPPKLPNWCRFQNGVACLAVKSGKWGIIDLSGEFVAQPTYDSLGPFSEGLAPARTNQEGHKRAGFIDRAGAVVIPIAFHRVRGFSDGLAAVQVAHLWGYVSHSGLFTIPPRFDSTERARKWPDIRAGRFVNGLAPVWVGQDRYRYIDSKGAFAFEAEFDEANAFSEHRAAVQRNGRHGYIDESGQLVIDYRFTLARDFSEGLAKVEEGEASAGKATLCGFVDSAGNYAIPARFHSAEAFENGLSLVTTEDAIGYIERTGEFVWEGPYVDHGVVV